MSSSLLFFLSASAPVQEESMRALMVRKTVSPGVLEEPSHPWMRTVTILGLHSREAAFALLILQPRV